MTYIRDATSKSRLNLYYRRMMKFWKNKPFIGTTFNFLFLISSIINIVNIKGLLRLMNLVTIYNHENQINI